MALSRKSLQSQLPQRDLDELARAMDSEDYRVRGAAVVEIALHTGVRKTGLLVRALGDPRKQIRAKAAQALGAVKTPQASAALVDSLRDRTATVRIKAIDSLRRHGDPDLIAVHVTPLLHDPDLPVIYRAVHACGSIKDHRMLEPLLAACNRPDTQLQYLIMYVLAPLRDLRSVPLLCSLARSGRHGVNVTAVHFLHQLRGTDLPRAILIDRSLPPEHRFRALESLRSVKAANSFLSRRTEFNIPPLRELCERLVRTERDAVAQAAAREMLDHFQLLRGSEPVAPESSLLRAVAHGAPSAPADELLRGGSAGDQAARPVRRTLWSRLFARRQEDR